MQKEKKRKKLKRGFILINSVLISAVLVKMGILKLNNEHNSEIEGPQNTTLVENKSINPNTIYDDAGRPLKNHYVKYENGKEIHSIKEDFEYNKNGKIIFHGFEEKIINPDGSSSIIETVEKNGLIVKNSQKEIDRNGTITHHHEEDISYNDDGSQKSYSYFEENNYKDGSSSIIEIEKENSKVVKDHKKEIDRNGTITHHHKKDISYNDDGSQKSYSYFEENNYKDGSSSIIETVEENGKIVKKYFRKKDRNGTITYLHKEDSKYDENGNQISYQMLKTEINSDGSSSYRYIIKENGKITENTHTERNFKGEVIYSGENEIKKDETSIEFNNDITSAFNYKIIDARPPINATRANGFYTVDENFTFA